MIQLSHIYKTFYPHTSQELKALIDLNLQIEKEDFITIIGGNGAGKSTLLNLLAGTISIDSGKLLVNGKDQTRQSESERARSISRVFQNPTQGTAPRMTIAQNMALALRRGENRGLRRGITKAERTMYQEQLATLQLGLERRLDTEIGRLSGGQRQAISLLMATLKAPELLLLDEHTAALDPKMQRMMMRLTQEQVQEKQLTTLMITHNLQDALTYGNRMIMMHRGRIVKDFPKEEKSCLQVGEIYEMMEALDQEFE